MFSSGFNFLYNIIIYCNVYIFYEIIWRIVISMDSFKFFKGYTNVSYRLKLRLEELHNAVLSFNETMDRIDKNLKNLENILRNN